MRNKEKKVKVKTKRERVSGATRRRLKRAQKAAEHLLLCQQIIEFHKAYLDIDLKREEYTYEVLQAQLEALQAVPEYEEVFVEKEHIEF